MPLTVLSNNHFKNLNISYYLKKLINLNNLLLSCNSDLTQPHTTSKQVDVVYNLFSLYPIENNTIIKKKIYNINTKNSTSIKLSITYSLKKPFVHFNNSYLVTEQLRPYLGILLSEIKVRRKKLFLTNRFFERILNFILFNKNVLVIQNNYTTLLNRSDAWSLAYSFLRKNKFLKKTRICLVLIQAFFAMLKYRDPKPVNDWIKFILEGVHYSKHRIYFYMIQRLLIAYTASFKHIFRTKGIRIYLSGKLGVGGNAKKRRKHFIEGKCSNTSKSLRREDIKNYIRTRTGVFAFHTFIFY